MFPIMLDLSQIRVLLVGSGQPLRRRMMDLKSAGAVDVSIHATDPDKVLELTAGAWLREDMPTEEDISKAQLVLVAGLPQEQATSIAALARAQGTLVNVEDMKEWCDFYYPAFLRRGPLVVAVSTSGTSPVLAQEVRNMVARQFSEEWEARLTELSAQREEWRSSGKNMKEVAELTRAYLSEKGWLEEAAAKASAK